MNRPVKHVTLHSTPFVDSVGQLKTTLSPSAYTGMRLNAIDQGVVVDFKGQTFIVPWGNIIAATFSGPDHAEMIRSVDAAAFRVVPKVA